MEEKKVKKIKLSDFKKLPNIISCFRLLVSLFILSSLVFEIKLIIIQVMYVLGALSDKADGIIARRFHWETRLGLFLEGIADGLLIFAGIIFISFKLDFPRFFLAVAFLIFIFGFLFVLLVYFMTKKWFTVTAPVVKAAVLASHIVVVFYIFSLSYRYEVIVAIFYAGLGLFCYYLVKMVRFAYVELKNRK
jgi:cardiolipin synthase